MLSAWQHIPEQLNPIAFSIGFFSVHWYALFYALALLVTFCIFQSLVARSRLLPPAETENLFLWLMIGTLLGARLGYVLFYNASYYIDYPTAIVWPFDPVTGVWTGIAGMSFHGGLIGLLLALVWYAKRRGMAFWSVADILALSAPWGILLGRLGNFWNGELHGRLTGVSWGMYFPGAAGLRHPSQLYEALGEGLLLGIILWFLRKRCQQPGTLALTFIIGYSIIRFGLEFFREPDPQIGLLQGFLSLGQVLSLVMFVIGLALLVWLRYPSRARVEGSQKGE